MRPVRPAQKKTKLSIKNPKKLTNEELLAILEDSSDELVSNEDDDAEFQVDSGSEESTTTDDESKNTQIPVVPQNPIIQVPAASTAPVWSDVATNMKIFDFSKTNELLQGIPGNGHPIDYFRLIFDNDILNYIVTETNRYAEERFLSEGVSENSRITRFKPVTSEEMQEMLTFIGLVFHTGTIRLNRLQDYWKRHPLFNLKSFSQHMSRDRFLLIMRCLHFADNSSEEQAPRDRLYKIRPIVDFFNNKMAAIYYPGKNLSLGESMVLWRGRLIFRQYIKNKKHKYGVKLYMLTEASGVILRTSVYTGAIDESGGKGHTTKVVLNLLNDFMDSRHSVYLDNFYNSFDIAAELSQRNTYCTGTLNAKRKKNPKQVVEKKLKRNETIAAYSNQIMIGKWKDKRDVLYISNEHGNELVQYVDRRSNPKEKPAPIYNYNLYMGGVDHQDQLLSYYPCDRKTLRWYTRGQKRSPLLDGIERKPRILVNLFKVVQLRRFNVSTFERLAFLHQK